MHASEKFPKKFLDIRQVLSYILWYHDDMDITAYWLNKKKDRGGRVAVPFLERRIYLHNFFSQKTKKEGKPEKISKKCLHSAR